MQNCPEDQGTTRRAQPWRPPSSLPPRRTETGPRMRARGHSHPTPKPSTMSPFLGQARPFCTNFPWCCRFFGPPSANLQSKGSDGAGERQKQTGAGRLHLARTPPAAPSLGPRALTCHSRGRLKILPIEVGDDGFTLLCGLHPKKHRRTKALTCPGHELYTRSLGRTRVPSPMHAQEVTRGTKRSFRHICSFQGTCVSFFIFF